jgi:hypothetical protein
MVYARDIDRLEQIDLATGEVTEIAIDLLPGSFGFTKLSSDWIVFPTRDRVMMLDARTGMVVSETWFPGFGPSPADAERRPGWVGGDGDTYILGVQALTVPPSVPTSQPTAWILSPNFPEGLVVTAPDTARNYWLSPDGKTLYAYTSERPNGPGTIWRTPLGETPDWQVVVEDVTPLPVPMMFWPGE